MLSYRASLIALVILGVASAPASAQKPAPSRPTAAEQLAIFKAAGFVRRGKEWRSACGLEDPSGSYSPGAVDVYRDINGDGRPEVVVTEGGTYCYGMTGQGFWLMSKQTNGAWKRMTQATGIPEFLKTKGVGGWPDISVGGPGFCFPVLRWNSKEYRLHRRQYEGKPCKG